MSNASDFIIENGVLKKYVGHAISVSVPEGVHCIQCEAFFHNEELEEVIIADSVGWIDCYAFVECPNLKHIIIPKAVNGIRYVLQREYQRQDVILKRLIQSPFYHCGCLHTAGPIGGGYNIEFGWDERIPDNAFPELTELTIPETLQEYNPSMLATAKRTIIHCLGTTFKLLPTELKENAADRWLQGQEVLDKTQTKVYSAFTKRTKNARFESLLNGDHGAGLTILLELCKPSLETLDTYIEKVAPETHPQMMAVLLNYKSKNFTSEQQTKLAEHQLDISMGVQERSLKEWKSIFRLKIQDDHVEILGYRAQDTAVTVPAFIDGKPVTQIGKKAFEYADVVEVYLPDTISEIGTSAFENCRCLQRIDLPDSLEKIGDHAFDGCLCLAGISLKGRLTCIEKYTFYCCNSLSSISLPDTVEVIEMNAFERCRSLTDIYLPEGLKDIGRGAFVNCPSFTVHAPAGSFAQQFAAKKKYPFVAE